MRILLVSPLPPPVGGIANWSDNLLNYYSNNKVRWEVFHQSSAIQSRSITSERFLDRFVGGIKDSRNILSEFRNNLETVKPDVVHITSSANLALFKDLLLIRLAAKRNISVVIHFHFGRIPELAKRNNWEWHLLKRVIKDSSRTIIVDRKSYETLIQAGFKNVVNVPNPVSIEIEEIALQRQLVPLGISKGRVIFVGHVIPGKGVFELVKACVSNPGVMELLIVGPFEVKIKNELFALAKERKNGDWINFTGSLKSGEVLNQIGYSSMLVLPSYTEGFPYVVLEAMAMGCPVIATKVGAIPDMLNITSDNPSGICVEPKNVDELSGAIATLLSDSNKAKALAKNGINRILTHYTLLRVSKQYEKIWAEALLK
jgi:glycosyltransferase involved in cell wall biosynthesis